MARDAQFDGSVDGTQLVQVSDGEFCAIHCDGDVEVSFFQQALNDFVLLETISAPGKRIMCTHDRMRLVTEDAVNIRVIREVR